MVKACSAPGCRYQYMKGDGIKMHSFPTNIGLKTKWIQAMQKEDCPKFPPKASVICSQHFENDCYDANNGKLSLKRNAVPSIFYDSRSIRPVVVRSLQANEGEVTHEAPNDTDKLESDIREIFVEVKEVEQIQIKVQPEEDASYEVDEIGSDTVEIYDQDEVSNAENVKSHDVNVEYIYEDGEAVDEVMVEEDAPVEQDKNVEYVDENFERDDDEVEYIEFVEGDDEEKCSVAEVSREDENADALPMAEPVRKRWKQPHYIGDFVYEDLEDLVQRRKYWYMTHKVNDDQKKKLKYYSGRVRVLEKRIQSLTKEIMELKEAKERKEVAKPARRLVFVADKTKC